ncbi:histidine triad nucleotide-binding protein [Ktedonobacter robiniae]|uniref:HIT-like protein n=1 Tax=Ktedonobacter robiniae TaxID=2778365 RepID=A0ABQ3UNQ7_9CHLR|nr:putative HIT-like protein [Ktedonobacter robiniae]
MENCLFCKIVTGEIPSKIVYQDDHVVAFEDIHPQAPVHLLVIPTRHIASMSDIEPDDGPVLAQIFTVAKQIAHERKLEDGYRFVTNVGPHAGQSVLHLHFHLLGGKPMGWPPFPPR